MTPFVARTWAPVGETPVLVHPWNWETLSAISAVALSWRGGHLRARLYFHLVSGESIKGPRVVRFLRQLARHVRGDAAVVWDGAPQHKGAAVTRFRAAVPRFRLVRLPGYCPELNPDEGVWDWVKTHGQPNLCVRNDFEMVDRTWGTLKRMQLREDLLVGCLKQTELRWGDLID